MISLSTFFVVLHSLMRQGNVRHGNRIMGYMRQSNKRHGNRVMEEMRQGNGRHGNRVIRGSSEIWRIN